MKPQEERQVQAADIANKTDDTSSFQMINQAVPDKESKQITSS